MTILLSFFKWNLLSSKKVFIGFGNYQALFESSRFLNAYKNALIWVVAFPLLSAATGLFLAVALWHLERWANLLRTIFILPMTVSYTAGGILWIYIYNPDFGLLNAILDGLHLSFLKQNWLSHPTLANAALVLSAVWLWSGFSFLIFRAGLSSIPEELLEAAALDGAGGLHRFFYVMLPLLKGSLTVVLGMSLLYALKVFDLVFTMTRGGPGIATEVPALLLWRQAFEFQKAGEAMANAVILSLLTLGIAWMVGRWIATSTRKSSP